MQYVNQLFTDILRAERQMKLPIADTAHHRDRVKGAVDVAELGQGRMHHFLGVVPKPERNVNHTLFPA